MAFSVYLHPRPGANPPFAPEARPVPPTPGITLPSLAVITITDREGNEIYLFFPKMTDVLAFAKRIAEDAGYSLVQEDACAV